MDRKKTVGGVVREKRHPSKWYMREGYLLEVVEYHFRKFRRERRSPGSSWLIGLDGLGKAGP